MMINCTFLDVVMPQAFIYQQVFVCLTCLIIVNMYINDVSNDIDFWVGG